jgi:hypothetical protein
MADFVRWCSQAGNAPAGVRELLQAAAAPAPMPAASHARALSYATELATGEAVGALSIIGGKVLAGGLVVGTACGLVALAVGHRAPTATVIGPRGGGDARSAVTRVAERRVVADNPEVSSDTRKESPRMGNAPAPAPTANVGGAPEPSPVGRGQAKSRRGARPEPRAEISKADHTAQTLAEEAALLDRARRALAADPALALRLSQTHAERFPHGQLLPASQVVAIDALRRLGRGDEARSQARRFLEAQPDSLYSDRVRKLIPAE